MDIQSITLRLIESPLKIPFITHLETVTKRQAIIIEAKDSDGISGFGEADPFSSPWYSGETIVTCWHALLDFLVPMTLQQRISDPSGFDQLLGSVRGNNMAKSGLGQAIWDLYARQKGVYIGKLFGSERKKVTAGAVIAAKDPKEAVEQIQRYSEAGYKRYKIKISRQNDLNLLSAIRQHFPDGELMADANSSYSIQDMDHLKGLDSFGLQMIEQPFAYNDLVDHAYLQAEIKTPVCLDESIASFQDARAALALGSCKIINIKMARVGGWSEAVRIHDLCLKEQLPVWCGGMIEFGVAKAHSIALASLKGFAMPGDLFASSRYWEEEIVEPEIIVDHGFVRVPDQPGMGFTVNRKNLEKLTVNETTIRWNESRPQ
ncbi:o-succinylbenzoate synthase [Sporolactobacillus shoreae]|uniref:o-succinylbenzoate synthase n=1 Tax=Sporolactobacillus shoreae TaxID=1465501 RepID=A0A4Z0GIL6_9BACL|nr:o-succinylbenzoate synthase [Sporolactobacillus shoreae]TGA96067.1 o-succinylbenzoate synthase [Sporolactobacillus shoreae]